MDTGINIRIGGDPTKAIDAFNRAQSSADAFLDSIKLGIGIDLGGQLVSSIQALPGMLRQTMAEGVALNSLFEDGARSLATLMGQFDSSAPSDFNARMAIASAMIDELREKGELAEGTFAQLFGAMTASSGAAYAANIRDLSSQIDLLVAASQVLGVMGGDQNALGQQLQQILTGNIDGANRLNQVLRLTGAEVKELIASGQLYEEIMRRFGPTLQDAEQGMGSLTSQSTLFAELMDDLKKQFAKPTFALLKESVEQLNEALSDPTAQEELKTLGYQVAELLRSGYRLTKWAIEHGPILLGLAKGASLLAVAYAAIKVSMLVQGLVGKTAALVASTTALKAETAALAANTAAQAANANARNTPTPARTPAAAGLGSAMNTGAALGTVGFVALHAYAASLNEASDALDAHGKSVVDIASKWNGAVRGASSVAEKMSIIEGISKDIAAMEARAAASNSPQEVEMLLAGIRALESMRDATRNLSDEKLQLAEAEAKSQAEAAAALEIEKALADVRAKYAESRGLRQRARGRESLIGAAESSGDTAQLEAERQKMLDERDQQKALMDGAQSKEDFEAAVKMFEELEAAIERFGDASARITEQNAEKAKQSRISELQARLALIDAEGQKQLAQVNSLDLAATDAGRRRKTIEDEIADRRLEIENEIGALQGENALAREAREVQAAAAAIERENQLASLRSSNAEREKQLASSLRSGRRQVEDGRINAGSGAGENYGVSGAQYDLTGNLIGGRRDGRRLSGEELGAINNDFRRNFGSPGNLMTPESALGPENTERGESGKDVAGSAEKLSEKVAELNGIADRLASAAEGIAASLPKIESAVSTLETLPGGIEGLAESLSTGLGPIGPAVVEAGAAAESKASEIIREVRNLSARVSNLRV